MKVPGLKLGVEKFGVEMSFNLQDDTKKVVYLYIHILVTFLKWKFLKVNLEFLQCILDHANEEKKCRDLSLLLPYGASRASWNQDWQDTRTQMEVRYTVQQFSSSKMPNGRTEVVERLSSNGIDFLAWCFSNGLNLLCFIIENIYYVLCRP